MRDAGGELPHRLELLRLPELLVALPALGHVEDRTEDDVVPVLAQHGPLGHHPAHDAVGADDPVLVLPPAGGDAAADRLSDALSILGVHERDVSGSRPTGALPGAKPKMVQRASSHAT